MMTAFTNQVSGEPGAAQLRSVIREAPKGSRPEPLSRRQARRMLVRWATPGP
jgi:hypothetical protein